MPVRPGYGRTVESGKCIECGGDRHDPAPLCWRHRADCAHPDRGPVKIRKANGLEEVRLRCPRCGEQWIGQSNRDHDMPSLPLFKDHTGKNPPCIVCARPDTELHHFAPTALFG